MRLSVIIPAYNHLDKVMRCFRSVVGTTERTTTDILVQDDASPEYDGRVMFPPGVCERNEANLGFPGNCNAGARRARGDVLLFLNQDCYATVPGWDAALLALFADEPLAAVCGPTLLFPDGRVQSVGGEFDALCQPYHIALGYINPDWTPINTRRQVQWVTGAAFAVRRVAWEALGGFDVVYGRGYFEDVDFCLRALLSGGQVWHEPGVRLVHEVGSTGGNPEFMKNAQEFKRRWVDSGVVSPDSRLIVERFWA